jgi:hypothetical protein
VSTLTPSQLARKRANDREAQRAIRARTKEHIERLEREIEELRGRNSRDETIQGLLRRNKALEQELAALRENLGLQTGRPYPPTREFILQNSGVGTEFTRVRADPSIAYPETLSAAGSAVSSRTSSFGQHSGEYSAAPAFGTSYVPTSEPCEQWTPGLNYTPSAVSSPTSSVANADEYITGYIPTSMPSSMMDGSTVMAPTSVSCLESKNREFPPCAPVAWHDRDDEAMLIHHLCRIQLSATECYPAGLVHATAVVDVISHILPSITSNLNSKPRNTTDNDITRSLREQFPVSFFLFDLFLLMAWTHPLPFIPTEYGFFFLRGTISPT